MRDLAATLATATLAIPGLSRKRAVSRIAPTEHVRKFSDGNGTRAWRKFTNRKPDFSHCVPLARTSIMASWPPSIVHPATWAGSVFLCVPSSADVGDVGSDTGLLAQDKAQVLVLPAPFHTASSQDVAHAWFQTIDDGAQTKLSFERKSAAANKAAQPTHGVRTVRPTGFPAAGTTPEPPARPWPPRSDRARETPLCARPLSRARATGCDKQPRTRSYASVLPSRLALR